MTFDDWIKATQPLLSAAVLPESLAVVRDGMRLAWDAAIEQAIEILPAHVQCDEEGRAIAALHSESPCRNSHSTNTPGGPNRG